MLYCENREHFSSHVINTQSKVYGLTPVCRGLPM